MSKPFSILFLSLLSLSFCCFCTKEDEKNQLAQQAKSIDDFIKRDTADARSKNKDTIITVTNKRATNRIVWNPGMGDTIAAGDTVAFAYIARIFSSGKGAIFSADYSKNAAGTGNYILGLDAGLVGMRTGEYAYIMFTSQYGYGNKEFSVIPKMSPLMFEVEIEYIIKKK
jgi:FKBP-type peptidyl-prolyl cis-trans isomerase